MGNPGKNGGFFGGEIEKEKRYNMDSVEIYGLAYGGMGVGKIDGKVCFVKGALPGEKVRFIKEKEKKRFVIGRLGEIITQSTDRVKPPCPYYNKCGGCQYQHLAYEKEVSYKGLQVREILEHIGGLKECVFEGIAPSPLDYGYRSSITVHRSTGGYGYLAADNRTVIKIDRCLLAADEINAAIGGLDCGNGKRDITLRNDIEGGVWISGHPGHRFFKDVILDTELTFSPLAFSQVNRRVTVSIAQTLRAWMNKEEREVLFDFYCGVGLFGALLCDMFRSVIGVDGNAVAIDCAKTTKKDLSAGNMTFYHAGEDSFPAYYERLHGGANTIILDPPRSGIGKDLIAWLLRPAGANSLYYISCDPATLVRDAKLLTQNGPWALSRVASFDMFPRTMHIESIALFKK
ncbi:MAG: class I SAM-dependent RNA methyltransferase [Candidatus Omnitrophica bacterium]|nr:class I SAM-dependent RNA methyltransferase [Candidatus Omnitrophota bacterium]